MRSRANQPTTDGSQHAEHEERFGQRCTSLLPAFALLRRAWNARMTIRAHGQATRQAKGVGLGLFVVAEFLQLHGGTIRVESSGIAGDGSRFILTLPLASTDIELS
jgi:light-regulated signal transduction histidine kinase (bacteriophytochrome)